ncbi:hypothetical protein GEMRC1_003962 [Eukaryota sp. GEM-RC1]
MSGQSAFSPVPKPRKQVNASSGNIDSQSQHHTRSNSPTEPSSSTKKGRSAKKIDIVAQDVFQSLINTYPKICTRLMIETATSHDRRRISTASNIMEPLGLVVKSGHQGFHPNIIQTSILANLNKYHAYFSRLQLTETSLLNVIKSKMMYLNMRKDDLFALDKERKAVEKYFEECPHVPGKVWLIGSPLNPRQQWLHLSTIYIDSIRKSLELFKKIVLEEENESHHEPIPLQQFNFHEYPPVPNYLSIEQFNEYQQNVSCIDKESALQKILSPVPSTPSPPKNVARTNAPSTPVTPIKPVPKKFSLNPDTPLGGYFKESGDSSGSRKRLSSTKDDNTVFGIDDYLVKKVMRPLFPKDSTDEEGNE